MRRRRSDGKLVSLGREEEGEGGEDPELELESEECESEGEDGKFRETTLLARDLMSNRTASEQG